MNIEKIDMACLPMIADAVKINTAKYLESDDYWLGEFISSNGYLSYPSNTDIEINYDVTSAEPSSLDFKNAVSMYKSMDITPELSGSGAFWTVLSHHYASYIRCRCGIKQGSENIVNEIKDNFVYPGVMDMRSRRKGILPRLWTIAYLSIDLNNTGNEYWLTEEAFLDQDVMYNIIDRSIFMNKDVVKSFLEYHRGRRISGNSMSRAECRGLYKFFHALGQTIVLESYNRSDFDALILKFEKWYSQKQL